jgi:hypothetical protein
MRSIFAFAVFLLLSTQLLAQSDKALTEGTVTKESIQSKIEFLASDEMKGRNTPSPELNIAAKYLASQLKGFGVKEVEGAPGYLQPVSMKVVTPPGEGTFVVGDSTYTMGDQLVFRGGNARNLSGKIVFAGYGSEEELDEAKVKGKFVIARVGEKGMAGLRGASALSKEKAQMIKDREGLGLIELYSGQRLGWDVIKRYLGGKSVELNNEDETEEQSTFPVLWMDGASNETVEYLKQFKKNASLNFDGYDQEIIETYNVVGMVEGTDPELKDEFVIFSAHYDHVGLGNADAEGDDIYNGTRDNAIGTVTVIEAAKNIGAHPTKRSALFIFFTGEEKGLLGSEWYADHPLIPLNEMVMCFNSDNAGYNDTTKATIVGLYRTTAGETIVESVSTFGLEAIPDPVPSQNLFDRSDQVNFAAKGVPAIMYGMGLTAFDDEILKYYHQAADNPSSVDFDYLYKFTKAYVLSCRRIANMPERPYWTEGDKYYEAGEGLYRAD